MCCYDIGHVDYNAGLFNILLPAGELGMAFNISITDDNILENVEEFNLTINSTSLPNRILNGDIQQTAIFITDDDGKVKPKNDDY